jgi:hypothetical protein
MMSVPCELVENQPTCCATAEDVLTNRICSVKKECSMKKECSVGRIEWDKVSNAVCDDDMFQYRAKERLLFSDEIPKLYYALVSDSLDSCIGKLCLVTDWIANDDNNNWIEEGSMNTGIGPYDANVRRWTSSNARLEFWHSEVGYYVIGAIGSECVISGCGVSHPFVYTNTWSFFNTDGSTNETLDFAAKELDPWKTIHLLANAHNYVFHPKH